MANKITQHKDDAGEVQYYLDVNGKLAAHEFIVLNYKTKTQVTSVSNTVTINAPSGTITLYSHAGSITWKTFQVNNNYVTANSVVYIHQKSGLNLIECNVTDVAAGEFRVYYREFGGSNTDSPELNFVVFTPEVP